MLIARVLSSSRRIGLRPRAIASLLGLHLAGTVFESIGLGMLLPVFQFVQAKGDIAKLTSQSSVWRHVVDAYAAIGLDVTLAVLLVTSFLAILLRQLFVFCRLLYTAQVRFNLLSWIRESIFVNYMQTKIGYQEQESSGAVVNDMITASDLAVTGTFAAVTFIGYLIVITVYVGILFGLSVWMTIGSLVVFGIAGLVLNRTITRSGIVGINIKQANERLSSHLVERLKALRLVRLAGTEEAEKDVMERLARDQRDHFLSRERRRAEISVAIEPVVLAFGLTFLYFGVVQFSLTLDQIGLFLVIVLRLLPVVKEAMVSRQTVIISWPSQQAVHRRFEAIGVAREHFTGIRELDRIEKGIRFENVGFSYAVDAGSRRALIDVSGDIPAHKLTALVGPSGSGKSTLIDLLPRLREPQEGRILIDGVPISEFSIDSLRKAIAFAPQVPQLFDGTIGDHIRYGNRSATAEEIRRAADLAGIAEFIETLPNGYETSIGEGGILLSGGQRQRLDLARALVRASPLLILDEPTSNLDADAEERFRQSLLRIRNETEITVILIAHRLSSVSIADHIIVLDRGRVATSGTHADLMSNDSWYAQALAKQQSQSLNGLVPERAR